MLSNCGDRRGRIGGENRARSLQNSLIVASCLCLTPWETGRHLFGHIAQYTWNGSFRSAIVERSSSFRTIGLLRCLSPTKGSMCGQFNYHRENENTSDNRRDLAVPHRYPTDCH